MQLPPPSAPMRTKVAYAARPMTKDYRRLWKNITSTTDEGEAVRTLTEILADKEGRAFIGNLNREDAGLCIEILDHVSLSMIHRIHFPDSDGRFIRESQCTT